MIINENGFQSDSFDEIFESFSDDLKDIYGSDINIDQDTPDGQSLALTVTQIEDLQNLALYIYNSFDPDFASGQSLNKILKLIAQTRLPATKSLVDVNVTVSQSVTLADDYTITDLNGQNWVIGSEQTLTAGTHLVSFECEIYGAINVNAGEVTEQNTIYTEVTSLNNPDGAVIGRDAESDQELRTRRNKLLSVNSTSTVGGLLGQILSLDNVDDAIVYENATDAYDSDKDLNAHTIWAVVKGGEIDEIAKTIAIDKTAGVGLKGDIEETYNETFERSTGTFRTFYHSVKFDRPSETELFLNVTLTKKVTGDSIDTQSVKDDLVALDYNIAQNITITELYATIYATDTNYIATDLEISKDDITYTNTILEADYDEEFKFIDSQINITVV